MTFPQRAIGAARLEVPVFEEIEADRQATGQALTLVQTRKVVHYPVVLMGATYWRGFLELLEDMVKAGTVSASDLKLFLVTDDLNEALEHIRKNAIEEFKLMRKPPIKPSRILREDKYPVVLTDQ